VTQPPYTADQSGASDSTATIQAAINAAETAGNGCVVYIPCGLYKITSTLHVSGSKFTVEGENYSTELAWYGGSNGTVFSVNNPSAVYLERFRIACLENQPSESYYVPTDSTSIASTITGIVETASTGGNCIYDEVFYNTFLDNNPVPGGDNSDGPGIVLSNLPSGAGVYMPEVNSPLNVQNCGAASIFGKFLGLGSLNVSGTAPKTGFLGFAVVEGGQQENSSGYNIGVTDNQNLVVGDYYNEQSWNDVSCSRGAGTSTGEVVIGGCLSASGSNLGDTAPTISLNVNNYAGRIYFGEQGFADDNGSVPVQITQTGSNPVDLDFVGCQFYNGLPTITTSSAHLYEAQNFYEDTSGNVYFMADTPNPLTSQALNSIAQGMDDLRYLGQIDDFAISGVWQAVLNNGFELDTVNPSPTTTLGHTPASWTVSNAMAAGSGVRNATVVAGGSPFGAGMQSLLWEDTTGSNTGAPLQVWQSFAPTAAASPIIETFDFCFSTTASDSDVWVSTGVGTGGGPAVHITSNGVGVYLGAGINGSDTYCASLTPGVWYRVRVVAAAPSAGKSNATLYVTPWNGTGPGTTGSYTIDGIPAVESTGFNGIFLSSSSYPLGSPSSVQFDNIGLVAKATLVLP
jgi:hypothetical protein